jgi:hypothetical protein
LAPGAFIVSIETSLIRLTSTSTLALPSQTTLVARSTSVRLDTAMASQHWVISRRRNAAWRRPLCVPKPTWSGSGLTSAKCQ